MKRGDGTQGDYAADTRVAQYLDRACRGLWGKERERLRDELCIHLDGLINSYRMAGMRTEDAVAKALEEMGPATKVSVGMARLHTWPLMTVMGLLACSIVALSLTLAPTVAQSLNALKSFPVKECITDAETDWYCKGGDWVNLDELATLLVKQGVSVDKVGDNGIFRVPGYNKVLLSANSQTYTFFQDDNDSSITRTTDKGYVQIRVLLEAFARAGVPVGIKGWNNLRISIADKSFDLNLDGDYNAQDFYRGTFFHTLANLATLPTEGYIVTIKNGKSTKPFRFDINAQDGEVYGVFINLDAETLAEISPKAQYNEDKTAFYFDLARVEAEELILELPDIPDIEFKSSIDGVVTNGEALLVRLTGKVNDNLYVPIPAEQVNFKPQ